MADGASALQNPAYSSTISFVALHRISKLIGIYLSSDRYIPFIRNLYTSHAKPIYVSLGRYISIGRMVRSGRGSALSTYRKSPIRLALSFGEEEAVGNIFCLSSTH